MENEYSYRDNIKTRVHTGKSSILIITIINSFLIKIIIFKQNINYSNMKYFYKMFCMLGFLLATYASNAQNPIKVKMGVEGGLTTYKSDYRENPILNKTLLKNNPYFSTFSTFNTSLNSSYVGIKAEFLSGKGCFTLLTGLRYTRVRSTLGIDISWNVEPYTLLNTLYPNGVEEKRTFANELKQNTDYLGIPLEMKLYITRPRFFRLYAKIGVDLNLNIHNRTSVRYESSDMSHYEQGVTDVISKPASFFSTFNPCLGFKFGKEEGLNFNVELTYPSYFITNKVSSIVTSKAGIGAQMYICYPIFKN